MSGDWRGTLWTLLVNFCTVIIRCKQTFWSPCIIVRYFVVSSFPPDKYRDSAWQQGTTATCPFQPPVLCCMLLPLCNWQIVLTIKNKTGNVRITVHWGASVQPLLQWKNNKYYIFWMCIYSLSYPARNPHTFILTSVDCPALQYFSILTHKRHDFRKKKVIKYVFWFPLQLLSETFTIFRKIERGMVLM
jgi:hypothetical protein